MDPFLFGEFFLIGLSTGILSGLFGVGGGFILVPLLVFVKVPIHLAVGTSLGYVACTSMAGAYKHFRNHNIHLQTATFLIMIASVMLVTVGISINKVLGAAQLKGSFALLLIATAIYFYCKRGKSLDTNGATRSEDFHIKNHWLVLVGLGSIIGLLSGIFGVGGGFLLVPILVLIIKMPIKLAVGTSLFVIIFSSFIGAIAHAIHGNMDFFVLLPMIVGGIAGAFLGASMAHRASPKHLQNGFICVLFLASSYMLYAAMTR